MKPTYSLTKNSFIVLLFLFNITISKAQMITNGNFETGDTTPWQIWSGNGAAGTIESDSTDPLAGIYSGKATLTTEGTAAGWECALAQSVSGSFGSTHSYQINFTIKGNANFSVDYLLQGPDNPWPTLYGNTINVTTSEQNYSQNFTVSEDGIANFIFRFGNIGAGNYFWVDDVEIIDLTTEGVLDFSGINSLSVFPNPTEGHLNLSFELLKEATVSIKIFDLTGKVVQESQNTGISLGLNNTSIDVSRLRSGIYWLSLQTENSKQTIRIIKE